MADEFCLKMPDFHVTFRDLLHAVNLRHGTNGFISLPKEGVLRIFSTRKNRTASAGFEPANLGTKGQRSTSRPPKPLSSLKNLSTRNHFSISNTFFLVFALEHSIIFPTSLVFKHPTIVSLSPVHIDPRYFIPSGGETK